MPHSHAACLMFPHLPFFPQIVCHLTHPVAVRLPILPGCAGMSDTQRDIYLFMPLSCTYLCGFVHLGIQVPDLAVSLQV